MRANIKADRARRGRKQDLQIAPRVAADFSHVLKLVTQRPEQILYQLLHRIILFRP
jgi:hypothetical protein